MNNPQGAPGPADGNASELAQSYAALIANEAAFPLEAARDLARLLSHNGAHPGRVERRHARLGLLIELASSGTGEYILERDYESARLERAGQNEQWPSASQLRAAYGHWLTAVKAATRFWFDHKPAIPASGHAHHHSSRAYSAREVMIAMLRFHESEGQGEHWPTEWEYMEWSEIGRRLARHAGKQARLPSPSVVRRRFGSVDVAVRATQRWVAGLP